MGIQEKVMKMAVQNALESLNENMPQMKLALEKYTEWKHKDLLKIKAVFKDISNLLENTNLPIKAETVEVLGTIALINADSNEIQYEKINKLISDLKLLLKD